MKCTGAVHRRYASEQRLQDDFLAGASGRAFPYRQSWMAKCSDVPLHALVQFRRVLFAGGLRPDRDAAAALAGRRDRAAHLPMCHVLTVQRHDLPEIEMEAAAVRPEWLFVVANRAQVLALTPLAFETTSDVCHQLQLPRPVTAPEEQLLRRFFGRHSAAASLNRSQLQSLTRGSDAVPCSRRDTRVREAVERAGRLLRAEHARRWTVASLARHVGCNRTDLEAAFARNFGWTVHVYLTRCRVDAATVLLRTKHWRILEIARAVGYGSKTSLYRAFDQTMGMTPEKYRGRWHLAPANNHVAELLNLDRHCQI